MTAGFKTGDRVRVLPPQSPNSPDEWTGQTFYVTGAYPPGIWDAGWNYGLARSADDDFEVIIHEQRLAAAPTYGELLKKAIAAQDITLISNIVGRAMAQGVKYPEIYAAARRVSGISEAGWDDLLMAAEDEEAAS